MGWISFKMGGWLLYSEVAVEVQTKRVDGRRHSET